MLRPAAAVDSRTSVAELVCRHGPVTATTLAQLLGVTAAAVRRHLDSLVADGLVTSRPLTTTGPRGRGRPARGFVSTGAGQDRFGATGPAVGAAGHPAREELATGALRFLDRTVGRAAVAAFARERAEALREQVAPSVAAAGPGLFDRARALAGALDEAGYAASTRPAVTGTQVCQGRCPVHRVAADFPELCEAETAAFAQLLGVPVQRLSTMAAGAHVCTTHITDTAHLTGPPIHLTGPRGRAAPQRPGHPGPAPHTTDQPQARPGERTM